VIVTLKLTFRFFKACLMKKGGMGGAWEILETDRERACERHPGATYPQDIHRLSRSTYPQDIHNYLQLSTTILP